MEDGREKILCMVWYKGEEWDRAKAVMTDRDQLPWSYQEWLEAAVEGERQLKAEGNLVVRVHIDIDEFCAWCAALGLQA